MTRRLHPGLQKIGDEPVFLFAHLSTVMYSK